MSLKVPSDVMDRLEERGAQVLSFDVSMLNAEAVLLWQEVLAEWPRDEHGHAEHADLLQLVMEYRRLTNILGRRLTERPVLNLRDYYKSEDWHRQRDLALDRANHECSLCDRTQGLQVHHRTYERVGREEPGDLIVLCRTCHARHHDRVA